MTAPNDPENQTSPVVDQTPPESVETPSTDPDSTETPPSEQTEEERQKAEMDALPEWARKALTKANGEAANYRTRLREAEQRLSSAKTPEEFEAATQELAQKNAELERNLLTTKVATKYDLPDDLAERLRGNTPEELEADAKRLASLLGPKEPERLSGGLSPDDGPAEETDPRKLRQRGRGARNR